MGHMSPDMMICLTAMSSKFDVSGVDVSMNGIELINREFIAAISEKREPNGSLSQCLPAMRVMHEIEKKLTD